ncbi:protein STPG4 isoform X3 [Anabas testudineus]|uniref:protein STPG4 isoform X3 n=1 Tax=Anabas testudineus TaxID=64144 RepID=UPI000E45B51C|nr:protein STPG4 isoform X3 [Anabas testudineus]
MSTVLHTSTWKNQAVCKVTDMSRGGNRADKGDDKVDRCGRGSWWLVTLKDTPVPGLYHIRDFIEEAELNPVMKTYGFKGVGRKAHMLGVPKGDLLLPGAYDYTDSTQEVLMRQASYSFKNCPRPSITTLNNRDKKEGPAPGLYNPQTRPEKGITSCFKSTLPRLQYVHSKTPGPGAYEPHWKLGDHLNTEVSDPSFSLFFRNVP